MISLGFWDNSASKKAKNTGQSRNKSKTFWSAKGRRKENSNQQQNFQKRKNSRSERKFQKNGRKADKF